MANLDLEMRGSICSSMGGETFASRKRKNTCTLRQHSIDVLAKNLKELNFDGTQRDSRLSLGVDLKKRFNSSFHYFRFLVVMFGGMSLGLMLLLRYNVTVAILNMVNQTAIFLKEHPDKTVEDFNNEGYTSTGEFDWDNEIQHMIMSWYMIAYTIPQMPCTKLGLKVGSRIAIPVSLILCAVSSLLVPIAAYWGWQWVIGLRLINGIGASAVLPMMLGLVENWMPYNEITLGLTCAQLLQAVMTAANPLVSGYLSAIHWSYAFYVPGFVTLAFCCLWLIFISDHPDENYWCSEKEIGKICGCSRDHHHFKCSQTSKSEDKKKINQRAEGGAKNSVVSSDNNNSLDNNENDDEDSNNLSWTAVFRVPSFYAYTFMWSFYCSPYSTFSFILPTYLKQFLKISVSQNGIYCFMIQCGQLVSVMWPHLLLRFFNEKLKLSNTASRRLAELVVCAGTGFTWFYVGQFHSLQLAMLFLNRCFHGANDIVVTGNLMSNFAKAGLSSIAFSMVNTVGNLSVVFASTFAGFVLDYTGQSELGWSYIFYGMAFTQLVMLTIFSTMIQAGPIEFKKRSKKGGDIENNQLGKGDGKQGSVLNKFDKSQTVTTSSGDKQCIK